MTPEEAFTGHKPCVSHLRVFGCRAYVHIPKHKTHTLDAKFTPMIFTGYATRSKGFRFWDPNKNDIILSRDAKFDEHTFGLQGVSLPSPTDDHFSCLEIDSVVPQPHHPS